jgi:hypothetical protein
MFNLRVPPQQMVSVELAEEALHLSPDDPDTLHGRVFVGAPIVVRLDHSTLRSSDEVLARYASQKNDLTFHYFQLDVGFVDDSEDPFQTVRLVVSLADDTSGRAIVRDIRPQRAWSAPPRTDELTIMSDLKFASFERRSERQRSEASLMAIGEGTSNARWDLRRVADVPIEGTYSLSLITECGSSNGNALISVTSTVHRRRLRLMRYRVQLPREIKICSLS